MTICHVLFRSRFISWHSSYLSKRISVNDILKALKTPRYEAIVAFAKILGNTAICFTNLGKTTSGFNFERNSRGVIRATTGYLRPIFAGYDFKAKIGGGPVTVQTQYLNKGPRESKKIEAKFGSISNSNQTKIVRSTTFILFSYTPPRSSWKKGKTDRITVTATKSSGETFSQQVPILLLI